ncbi:MAG: general secretion pathway protein GspK [Acidobacteriia bacterium]|nr:general secretion pathway protein GspK [Terriglobia bacterium]
MTSAYSTTFRDHEGGVALLAVLWALTLLSLVALALSSSVQDEVRTATYRKEAAQAYALACGGVDTAIMAVVFPQPDNPDKPPFWTWKPGQREGIVPFPGGRARLLIEGESGKLDLNAASRVQLIRRFEMRGLAAVRAEDLAAAILHWRAPEQDDDPDAQALDEYYQRVGIQPRHDRFRSVEEVLNVRGMSREIFYGTVEVTRQGKVLAIYGVGQDLTVMSGSSQVNVNYASEYVLRSVPEITADLASSIIQERRTAPFSSVVQIGDRTAALLPDEALPYLTTGEGNTYRITSTGEIAGSVVHRTVEAFIQLDSQVGSRYRLVAWYDDVSAGEGGR